MHLHLLGFGPFIYFQLFGRTLAEVNIPVLQLKITINNRENDKRPLVDLFYIILVYLILKFTCKWVYMPSIIVIQLFLRDGLKVFPKEFTL